MPVYNWECTQCETVWEVFQSMTERDQDPPITGEGAYYPDKWQ